MYTSNANSLANKNSPNLLVCVGPSIPETRQMRARTEISLAQLLGLAPQKTPEEMRAEAFAEALAEVFVDAMISGGG